MGLYSNLVNAIESNIDLFSLFAGGPGSGWTTENGHIAHPDFKQHGFVLHHVGKVAVYYHNGKGLGVKIHPGNGGWRVGPLKPRDKNIKDFIAHGKGGFALGKFLADPIANRFQPKAQNPVIQQQQALDKFWKDAHDRANARQYTIADSVLNPRQKRDNGKDLGVNLIDNSPGRIIDKSPAMMVNGKPFVAPAMGDDTKEQQDNPVDIAKDESVLLTSPISSKKNLGGGISKTELVTFGDGSKGVFKPASGEYMNFNPAIKSGTQTEREVGAWEVAKLVGMQDIVQPTVKRTINGEVGSVQKFANGQVAKNVQNGATEYDGDRDLARAAAFDYVLGNTDRHTGNWLVENPNQQAAKLHLIDHGLSFPAYGNGGLSSQFVRKATAKGLDVPSAPFVNAKDKILAALTKIGLPATDVQGVGNRIDKLSKQKIFDYRLAAASKKPLVAKSTNDIVRILLTTEKGQIVAGYIKLKNGKLSISPKGSTLLRNICRDSIVYNNQQVSPKDNPSLWFEGLPYQYNGAYLRAEMVKAVKAEKYAIGTLKDRKQPKGTENENQTFDNEIDNPPSGKGKKLPRWQRKYGSTVDAGGPGSGRHKEFGKPVLNRYGKPITTFHQKKALEAYKPATQAMQALSHKIEGMVRDAVNGDSTPNHSPFDVIAGKHAIEVKAMHNNTQDKITVRAAALSRKYGFAKKNGMTPHTVVVDMRGSDKPNAVYYKAGVGSFRISGMVPVKNGLAGLKAVIK